jgi:hypothetical protein
MRGSAVLFIQGSPVVQGSAQARQQQRRLSAHSLVDLNARQAVVCADSGSLNGGTLKPAPSAKVMCIQGLLHTLT